MPVVTVALPFFASKLNPAPLCLPELCPGLQLEAMPLIACLVRQCVR
jgi:hypothetical protein